MCHSLLLLSQAYIQQPHFIIVVLVGGKMHPPPSQIIYTWYLEKCSTPIKEILPLVRMLQEETCLAI